MDFFLILLVFTTFRILDLLIIVVSKIFIPYLGFFPYKELLADFHLSNFITSLANFDGLHYLMIAKNGYSQYEQAFFPLYPLLIKFLGLLFLDNYLIAGLVISNLSFLLGLYIFSKYLKLLFKNNQQWNNPTILTILFLLFFPTSFFFGAVYTEGLFFFLLITSLYFLKKEQYSLAAIFAILSSLTRLVGVFLIIPISIELIQKLKIKSQNHKSKLKKLNFTDLTSNYYLLTAISPIIGLLIYCLYLWLTTGDALMFLHSQWAFGANRTSNLILLPQVYYRYINIFLTANHNFQYFIALFEFAVFNFVLIILILDLLKLMGGAEGRAPDSAQRSEHWREGNPRQDPSILLGLNLFSFANLLLPTLTGTLSSIPRYALFSISFFLYLSQIKNRLIKITLVLIFAIFHIIMLGFFSQGYFVS